MAEEQTTPPTKKRYNKANFALDIHANGRTPITVMPRGQKGEFSIVIRQLHHGEQVVVGTLIGRQLGSSGILKLLFEPTDCKMPDWDWEHSEMLVLRLTEQKEPVGL